MMARTNRHNEPPRWLLGVSLSGGLNGRHFFEPTGNQPLYLRRMAAFVGSLALLFGAAIFAGVLR